MDAHERSSFFDRPDGQTVPKIWIWLQGNNNVFIVRIIEEYF